jgi:hypothetical protein
MFSDRKADDPTPAVPPANSANGRLTMMRYGRIEEMDRAFDLAFWQAQDATARWKAGWELVELYLKLKGRSNELRLQRTVESFQRQQR